MWTTNAVLSLRLCKVFPNWDEGTVLTSSLLFYLVSSSSVILINFILVRSFPYYISQPLAHKAEDFIKV